MKVVDGVSVNLYDAMSEIFDEITEDVHEEAAKAAKKAAETARDYLKENSPTKSGKYKKGWAVKKLDDNLKATTYVVYNKSLPGLTHLLENGHTVVNKYGEYGRTNGKPHIVDAAKIGAEEFVEEATRLIEEKLNE